MDWLREETDYSIEEIELIRYGLTSIVKKMQNSTEYVIKSPPKLDLPYCLTLQNM